MKVLLFGPDGQVGRALQAALPVLGGEVVAAGRSRADFTRPGALAQVVAAERPDVIVNAAAHTAVDKAESEPDLAERINALAPAEIAAAAAAHRATLIHYSTDYVFDGAGSTAHSETDATAPLSVYGRTKREGEVAVAASGAPHLIFRTSWVHAPGGNNFIAKMLSLASERDELRVIDDQVGAPTSAALIADISVRVMAAAMEGRPLASGIYHLVSSGETTWNGYARFVIENAMQRGVAVKATPDRVLPVPTSAFPTPARRPLNSRLSTAKLRAALGVDLPDWRIGVLETLEAVIAGRTA
ncbi:dTDP-4-dehydrorhamnose reductase [Youhaiella tibetensis]|uniref:dTDP-4-dehydrorhamnose reductase n=1 Tax=Paradevosia tibetensis TaxID=1447062 RepID=A0A5B9DKD6_9HYPH|nr:dTDP-4-dehydrorhamnose reductase [Youhaiella tibetensis]QEE19700.1 dTDP-4-dehydrorhamnose reductase [Youhaiella tibetensis]